MLTSISTRMPDGRVLPVAAGGDVATGIWDSIEVDQQAGSVSWEYTVDATRYRLRLTSAGDTVEVLVVVSRGAEGEETMAFRAEMLTYTWLVGPVPVTLDLTAEIIGNINAQANAAATARPRSRTAATPASASAGRTWTRRATPRSPRWTPNRPTPRPGWASTSMPSSGSASRT